MWASAAGAGVPNPDPPCPAGQYSTAGATACLPCSAGAGSGCGVASTSSAGTLWYVRVMATAVYSGMLSAKCNRVHSKSDCVCGCDVRFVCVVWLCVLCVRCVSLSLTLSGGVWVCGCGCVCVGGCVCVCVGVQSCWTVRRWGCERVRELRSGLCMPGRFHQSECDHDRYLFTIQAANS